MTITQEMIMTLFTKDTINKVKEQFSNGKDIVPIDSFDMSFRLFKSNSDNINLEVPIQMPLETGEENDGHGVGIKKMVVFFQPIGFYTQKKGFLSNDIEVTIMKGFEEDFDFLIKNNKISSNIKIHKLTLEENAVIASISIEALIAAERHKDGSFKANGLEMDIYMTYDNEYPQSFLNDKYGLKEHIGAYFLKNNNQGVTVNIRYEAIFNKFRQMGLLTLFKRL